MSIPIELIPCTTVGIFGPPASGKTYLEKELIRILERSVTYDVAMEIKGEEFEHFYASPKVLTERIIKNPYYYRIAYHANLNPEQSEQDFHLTFATMWLADKDRWFIIDEVVDLCSANYLHPDMRTMLQLSRHVLLGLICGSQRIAEVHKRLTQACRMVILFYTSEIRDIQAISDRWGNEIASAVSKLRPLIYNDLTNVTEQTPQCLVWKRGEGYKIVDLGATAKTNVELPSKEETQIKENQTSWDEDSQEQQEMQVGE